MIDQILAMPWWCWPVAVVGLVAGLVIGSAAAFAEGAVLAGENPVDRFDRWRAFVRFAIYWLRHRR